MGYSPHYTANIMRKRVLQRQRTLHSNGTTGDVEKNNSKEKKNTNRNSDPDDSALPSRRSSANPGSIKADLRVLEDDAGGRASPEQLQSDIQRLLEDCEVYLRALVETDDDAVRRSLSRVFTEKDGLDDPDQARILLTQDEDSTVRVRVIRNVHCAFEQLISASDNLASTSKAYAQ